MSAVTSWFRYHHSISRRSQKLHYTVMLLFIAVKSHWNTPRWAIMIAACQVLLDEAAGNLSLDLATAWLIAQFSHQMNCYIRGTHDKVNHHENVQNIRKCHKFTIFPLDQCLQLKVRLWLSQIGSFVVFLWSWQLKDNISKLPCA
jgi:hypothetical protein